MIYIHRHDYKTNYQYRKAIGAVRRLGWLVRNTESGVVCFEFIAEYDEWRRQRRAEKQKWWPPISWAD